MQSIKTLLILQISHSHVKPSHQKHQFGYLMSNVLEWTDFIDGGNSFNMTKIANLLRANPCKNQPKSPIRGKAQKIKIATLLQTGRL